MSLVGSGGAGRLLQRCRAAADQRSKGSGAGPNRRARASARDGADRQHAHRTGQQVTRTGIPGDTPPKRSPAYLVRPAHRAVRPEPSSHPGPGPGGPCPGTPSQTDRMSRCPEHWHEQGGVAHRRGSGRSRAADRRADRCRTRRRRTDGRRAASATGRARPVRTSSGRTTARLATAQAGERTVTVWSPRAGGTPPSPREIQALGGYVQKPERRRLPQRGVPPRREGRRRCRRRARGRPGRDVQRPEDLRADVTGPTVASHPGPAASTPDANPYMPTRETGSVDFKQAHPTWDGRGITIGILDSGVDLDHPALQKTTRASARSSTGSPRPTRSPRARSSPAATPPGSDGPGRQRHRASRVREVRTYTLPAAAPTRSARFNERGPNLAGARSAATSTATATRPTASASCYDPVDHDVWVDTDHDKRLHRRDRDAAVPASASRSGTSAPTTPRPRSARPMPFTVDVREDLSWRRSAARLRVRRHRHRRPAPTARTSPASPPPTTCSAARWTARPPARSSSRPAPAPSAPAAPPPP